MYRVTTRQYHLNNIGEKIKRILRYGLYVLAIILALSLIQTILKVRSAGRKIEETRQKVEGMREKNRQLESQLFEATSESYFERQARDSLGLAKPGEAIVILPDEETLRDLAPKIRKEEEIELPQPNWRKWLDLFF